MTYQCFGRLGVSWLQGMLPPEAQDHERVRAQLTWALNAMNSAMEGVPLQYAQPQPAAGAGYAYAGAAGGCTHPPPPLSQRTFRGRILCGECQWHRQTSAMSSTMQAMSG